MADINIGDPDQNEGDLKAAFKSLADTVGIAASVANAAPNDIVPVLKIGTADPFTGAADQDFALVPKGAGAILAAVPGAGATLGDKRGAKVVDLQMQRDDATQVASGLYACIPGGNSNKATGEDSFAAGYTNLASNYATVAMGANSQATGDTALAIGSLVRATGDSSVAMGSQNLATGHYSAILGGQNAHTHGIYAKRAFAGGTLTGNIGDTQVGEYSLSAPTVDDTPVVLTTDGFGTPDATNQLVLQDYSSITFDGLVSILDPATGDTKAWTVVGLVKRGNGAATTALVAAVVPGVIASDASVTTAALAVTADTTNGAIAFTVTGLAGTPLDCNANIRTAETTHAPA